MCNIFAIQGILNRHFVFHTNDEVQIINVICMGILQCVVYNFCCIKTNL